MKMRAAMFSTHLSVSAKLVIGLNLAYCLSLSGSSFGPQGLKRELLDRRKRASATVKAFLHHMKQRGEQLTMQGIPWVKIRAAMFSTHLSVSAKLVRMLNLAYCMSLSDSSFGPEGQKRELLDLRKRASARGTQQLFSVKYVFEEANIT